MNNHFNRFAEAYFKGSLLVVGHLAVTYVAAVKLITPEQWAAMDSLHRSAFWVGFIGSASFTLIAFLSSAVADAKALPVASDLPALPAPAPANPGSARSPS